MSTDTPSSTPSPSPAPRKAKRFRRYSWKPEDVVTLWLAEEPNTAHQTTWAVYDVEEGGEPLGYLTRYSGSLDRKVGRLRVQGKQRTLWSTSQDRLGGNYWQQDVSAADALRRLLRR